MQKILRDENGVIAAINELIAEASSNSGLKKFFAKSLDDLLGLELRIGNRDTRIAIIGITSSGKSTLMNAVLGAPLLPTRVGPSSSKQVLCGWDEKCEAEIIFDSERGKEPCVVRGSVDAIRRSLEQYGDERYNPNNREGVDEIRVHAPGFRFNRDLVIIDTPGLDAYGLDQHKEVTLKLVLPTVDMVLFLTNVKCDSDGANLEFIDNATSDDKPLIVIQNKIDSIESKVTRQGVVKTAAEVKAEHRRRLERLLSHARKASVRNAPIVQVSAKSASWHESNLAELGRVLDEQIRVNSSFRLGRRVRQLATIVSDMREALRPRADEAVRQQEMQQEKERRLSVWRERVDELAELQAKTVTEIRRRLSEIEDVHLRLIREIDDAYTKSSISAWLRRDDTCGPRYYREDVRSLSDSVRRLRGEFETAMRNLNGYFSSSITETRNLTCQCCANLNLEESQTIRSVPFHCASVVIASKTIVKKWEETVRIKQRGFGGFLKRFFTIGHCGYDKEKIHHREEYVDIADLVQQIDGAWGRFNNAFSQQLPVYVRNGDFAVGKLRDELDARKTALRIQVAQAIPVDVAKKMLLLLNGYAECALANASGMVRNASTSQDGGVPLRRRFVETTLSPAVFHALRYAHLMSFECPYRVFENMVRLSGMPNAFICGWDAEKLASFREWFVRPNRSIRIVDWSREPDALIPQDTVAFLLVNAEQMGSFKGKLLSGRAAQSVKNLASRGKIVWVMDSVREHVDREGRGDSLVDAFDEMMTVAKTIQGNNSVFGVMACDRELYWTVLLHELYFNRHIHASENARQHFVDDISNLFRLSVERRHATGAYVAQFNQ